LYGLGSENQNLPAYVVLDDPRGLPVNGVENWQAGFLPPLFQGTRFRSTGSPVLNLKPESDRPESVTKTERELIAKLDAIHKQQRPGQPILDARIASYELAARMQLTATDALDLAKEPLRIQEMYGIGREPTDSFGRRCLLARRLVERGVRFVQVWSGGGQPWDNHNNLAVEHRKLAGQWDQPIAALLTDLQSRGLLDSTLVICNGEFGRLPIVQKGGTGRDHNPHAFTTWLAGGGVKGGVSYGASDEIGFKAVENRVSINDFHATVLHLLGLDHKKLTYRYNGRDFRLTDVYGNVIKDILA
jgi:hypothetical protein